MVMFLVLEPCSILLNCLSLDKLWNLCLTCLNHSMEIVIALPCKIVMRIEQGSTCQKLRTGLGMW